MIVLKDIKKTYYGKNIEKGGRKKESGVLTELCLLENAGVVKQRKPLSGFSCWLSAAVKKAAKFPKEAVNTGLFFIFLLDEVL